MKMVLDAMITPHPTASLYITFKLSMRHTVSSQVFPFKPYIRYLKCVDLNRRTLPFGHLESKYQAAVSTCYSSTLSNIFQRDKDSRSLVPYFINEAG